MAVTDAPSWISVARGRAPILLLAPHGGRRDDVRPPGKHKVNDLLTADLTRELAAACGASMIINESLDRNLLDLNRLSQVRRDAPWMIPLLANMLGAMVSEVGHATVLVVHGWNVTQAACDLGVGLREHAAGLVPVRADTATVSEPFVATHLRPLQEAAAAAGITVTIGTRYPAAHPNNLLQMFRGVADRDAADPCPIAALCRNATIEAVQLELAIPLRWPGPRRDRFLALLADVFAKGTPRDSPVVRRRSNGVVLRSSGGRVTRRRGLQFVADEMLVMTSIDVGEAGGIAGRLVISRDPDRLALFTGELGDPTVAWTIPPLTFEPLAGGGARVAYEGPLVGFPTLTPFLDLERGLAGGTLIEARVDLTFAADQSGYVSGSEECFGDVRGKICLDGRAHAIATRGVASNSGVLAPRPLPDCRITLPISPLGALLLDVDPAQPLVHRDRRRLVGALVGTAWAGAKSAAVRASCDLQMTASAGSIALEVISGDGRSERLIGVLDRLIPIRRPGREGTVIETTFALVRIGGSRLGWVEVTLGTEVPSPRR